VSAPCPVFGFTVDFRVEEGLDDAAESALWASFIGAIDERGLMCGGGYTDTEWSHVVHSEAGQATDADRDAIVAWSKTRPEIIAITVGPLRDIQDDD